MIDDILHFLKIDERIGSGGQPTAKQLSEVANAGYRVVINLALPTSDNAVANEGEVVTSLGMTYVHLPVHFDNPTPDDFEMFCGIMNAFRDRRVFVHCAMNMRVSAFVFMYRVRELNVPKETAVVDLHKLWIPDATWQRLINHITDPTK